MFTDSENGRFPPLGAKYSYWVRSVSLERKTLQQWCSAPSSDTNAYYVYIVLSYDAFFISVNGEPTRVSHVFVKKNMVRYMRLHGRFVHCSSENTALTVSINLSASTAGSCYVHTRGAENACLDLLYRNILRVFHNTFKKMTQEEILQMVSNLLSFQTN